MIQFERFVLDNGLQIVVHEAPHSLVAAVNIMYAVGSRDEDPNCTGLAHLCEHLMFTGSQHIPSYDAPLQQVGGTNNAYTSSDFTSYYCTLPVANLETAFWLESDRMLGLALDPDSLAVQKKVVIEEFKEVCLNQPYGDALAQLSQLAYTHHPYQWPVIGKAITHIEQVTLLHVKTFLSRFYTPNNAVLVVAGAVKLEDVKRLSQKWFGSLVPRPLPSKQFPQEPSPSHPRKAAVTRPVPLNAIYKAFPMASKLTPAYDAAELFCTAIGEGKSSRLYQELVDAKAYFNSIESYITETVDPGLLVIAGRVNPEVPIEVADAALSTLIETARTQGLTVDELAKAQNYLEANFFYDSIGMAQRAEALAMATLLGDTHLVNTRLPALSHITLARLTATMLDVLQEQNSVTLYYQRKQEP